MSPFSFPIHAVLHFIQNPDLWWLRHSESAISGERNLSGLS